MKLKLFVPWSFRFNRPPTTYIQKKCHSRFLYWQEFLLLVLTACILCKHCSVVPNNIVLGLWLVDWVGRPPTVGLPDWSPALPCGEVSDMGNRPHFKNPATKGWQGSVLKTGKIGRSCPARASEVEPVWNRIHALKFAWSSWLGFASTSSGHSGLYFFNSNQTWLCSVKFALI